MINVGNHNEATRVAWLERTLTRLPPGARILDAGAGEQRFRSFCTHLDYVSQDFGKYDGEGDRRGLQMGTWDQSNLDIVSDIISIPEPDASFDAVLCVEVFEHLPDPVAAIREFSRLLRPGGEMILTAPFCSITHFAPHHYFTGFNRYFYETHLTANGFSVEELVENGNFFEYLAQEVRRVPEVCRRYTTVSTGLAGWIIMRLALLLLCRYSDKDTGSSELLNFGYFVRAFKNL